MATRAQNIEARLDAIAEELAALGPTVSGGTSKAGGLPDASGDPAGIQHTAYRRSLLDEMRLLREELAAADGAFEVTSEMYP
jgi:hypothetical protein